MIEAKARLTKLVINKTKDILLSQLPSEIETELNEIVCDLVQEGIEAYHSEQMSKTLENISKKHQIPLELLLRDVPGVGDTDRCKGKKTLKDGSGEIRCKFKASENGYCKYHHQQGEKIKQRCLPNLQLHNHGPEKMNVPGCPGCERKGLIELSRLFANE
jgi:hypothetical protein